MLRRVLTYFIVCIWIGNGLFCKVLDMVPRHEQIVAEILGSEYSGLLIKAIGGSEIFMAIWILSGIRSRLCAIAQMSIVAGMNIMEFILVPELLLYGRLNALFAVGFILIVYINEFVLKKRLAQV